MAPAARPAFLKGAGGPPSIEAAGHLLGPTPGDQSEQALLPSRPRWRRCSCCRVGARCAPGPGPPQASLLRSCRGTGQGVRATVLRPVVGCTCPARATGPCPRAPAAGGAGAGLVRWLWALGLRPQHDNTTTQQHNKGPAGGGQGAQWPRPWPRVGIHMHRARARGAALSLACAVLVKGERPAAGVAGGCPWVAAYSPQVPQWGPQWAPKWALNGAPNGLSMRSHWPHPTVVVSSEIGYYRSAALYAQTDTRYIRAIDLRKFALTFHSSNNPDKS